MDGSAPAEAPEPPSANPHCRLLSLPAELRVHIYKELIQPPPDGHSCHNCYVFFEDEDTDVQARPNGCMDYTPNLMIRETCQQIDAEVTPLIYDNFYFMIRFSNAAYLDAALNRLGARCLGNLKKLVLDYVVDPAILDDKEKGLEWREIVALLRRYFANNTAIKLEFLALHLSPSAAYGTGRMFRYTQGVISATIQLQAVAGDVQSLKTVLLEYWPMWEDGKATTS